MYLLAVYPLASILAGPVVRRAESGGVSIWLALAAAAEVQLSVKEISGQVVCSELVSSKPIGAELHLALVHARCSPGRSLKWGQEYLYELAIDGQPLEVSELLYAKGPDSLSFCLPGATLDSTQIVHGSCRHPSEPGKDALSILDDLVEASFEDARVRPQLFVCSGDLIYADSPCEPLLKMVGEIGDRLLGYREELPGLSLSASEIPLEDRQSFAGDLAKIYDPPKRQLFGLGEFLAMHLLVLSPTLWPTEVAQELSSFHESLSKVRRALANTAFYAIFDDHEITDDWYLTRAWSERVLGSALGRTMVCNGLSAFALVHAWGNDSSQFEEDSAGASLLQRLCGSRAEDTELCPLLGVPNEVGDTLRSHEGALSWHFRLQTPAIDLRGLDTRTLRHFPGPDPHRIPDQLSEEAISNQLGGWQGLPVLVSAAPFAPPPWTRTMMFLRRVLDRRQSSERHLSDVYIPDRGDEWVPNSKGFQDVLNALPANWVCLGGDTHISYAASLEQKEGTAAIFVSSGMQRQNRERTWRQRIGYRFPWPFLPGRPEVKTESFVMRYLATEKSSEGKTYEYFAQNNIGTLHFEDKGLSVEAVHIVWWRKDKGRLASVPTRVPLGKRLAENS